MSEERVCYICNANRFVDDHHYDCAKGKISPETVPLCRRCHRTYHDLGVDYFDDEYLDKAIEIENKRREIVYANLKDPVMPLELLRREDIRRSAYWYKQHGIPTFRLGKPSKPSRGMPFRIPNSPALCGEDWLKAHLTDHAPEEIEALTIKIGYNNRWLQPVFVSDKRGTVKTRLALVLGGE